MPRIHRFKTHAPLVVGLLGGAAAALYGCSDDDSTLTAGLDGGATDGTAAGDAGVDAALPGTAGPDAGPQAFAHPVGNDPNNGRDTFRFETFGNEGYWTRVLELPQGMVAKGVTPAMALAAGLSVDIDSVPADLLTTIKAELTAAGPNADITKIPSMQVPTNTVRLVQANAVIGVVARKNHALLTGDTSGTLAVDPNDIFAGESVGVSCAICHGITDGSTVALAAGGSIGHRLDGPTNHNISIGALVALANHSVAFYPTLALDLTSNGHKSVSRKGVGVGLISATPSEAEVDAYLSDPSLYPVGMFDDQPDGNGAPLHITPFFRTDLAAPWGSEGSIHMLQNFSNLVYTALLDPTDLLVSATAPNAPTDAGAAAAAFSGPQYLEYEKGGAAGLEILANYKAIIEGTLGIPAYAVSASGVGNNGYPYVGRPDNADCVAAPAGVENESSIGGLKCNQAKLINMNAYLNSLRAPAGVAGDPATVAAGRAVFRQQCTSCHNDDQSIFVPEDIIPFNNTVDLYSNAPARPALYPGYNGVQSATRPGSPFAQLVPVRDDATTIFDDKLIITEASNYQQPRGDALPLLMDLARKPSFLHDDEVKAATPTQSLSLLLDPARGATVPHPFYVPDATQRAAVIAFLQSLDDNPLK